MTDQMLQAGQDMLSLAASGSGPGLTPLPAAGAHRQAADGEASRR
jgi:hypothetical protein